MWYVIQALGNEDTQDVCDKCRRVLPEGLVKEFFIPKYTCMQKYQGEWREKLLLLFPDYIFLDTEHAEEVEEHLKVLSGILKPVCVGDEFVPVYPEEQKFLEELMDAQRVIQKSTGDIIDGKFHIYEGPLMDEKKHPMIRKVDRHKKIGLLELSLLGNVRTVKVGLEIVRKV